MKETMIMMHENSMTMFFYWTMLIPYKINSTIKRKLVMGKFLL